MFGTGTAYPDLVVAGILAMLGVSGGWQIIRQARADLRKIHDGGLQPAENPMPLPLARLQVQVRLEEALFALAHPVGHGR